MATWLNYYYFNQQASQSPPLLTSESINPFWYFSNFMQLLPIQVCKVFAVVLIRLRACDSFQKIKITILEKKDLIYKQQEVSFRILLLSPFVLCYRCKETRPF